MGTVKRALAIGPLRAQRKPPSRLWTGGENVAVVTTEALGFTDGSEPDRTRWLHAFRRLLDGLDSQLEVVIEVDPGPNEMIETAPLHPRDFDEMRGNDLWFADQLAELRSACRRTVTFVIAREHSARLEAALREIGVGFHLRPAGTSTVYGRQHASLLLHSTGFSRTWYVERLPGLELDPGWLFGLLPPGLRVTLSWHATPLPSAWVVGYLQRQLVSMRASRLQNEGSDPALAAAVPAAEGLQRKLATSQEKAFHVSIYLTVSAPTMQQLELGATRIDTASRAALSRLEPCTFRMLDGYLATLPVGVDRLRRKRVLDTSALATMLPWSHAELRQIGGLTVGTNRATGCPVTFDPFDHTRYANANIAVFGHSGAGKTYLLSALAMAALGCGVQVFLIDPEHEYGRLATLLGGVDVQLALGSGHALNVLDLRPSEHHDEAWLGPAAADAVDLCSIICGGLDEPERALIEAAVRSAYRDRIQPVLRDVAERLPSSSRAAVILGRWVQGSLGQMFSSPTNIDLEAPIVAFGMRELRDEMVAPVHFLLAEALWTRIKRKERRRMLVVDELGLLFEDPTIRRFVVSLARRIRKYQGSLMFATQNPGDLLSSESGSVVATNPAIAFFGAQRPGEAAKLQRTFHLSQRQRSFLESARRGEFLLSAGVDRLSIEVKAPPWQEDLIHRARSAARPPPRNGRLTSARAASPSLPHLSSGRSPVGASARSIRSACGCSNLALRSAVDRQHALAQPVRDGVLPTHEARRAGQPFRSGLREDGGR